MDLSHNLQQLQGFAPLAGRPSAGIPCVGEEPFASTLNVQRANALSQMNLRAVPGNGFGERSASLRDLAQPMQSSSSAFQLSGPAMLVGTVAALQEESGQLRSQWKADVARLEGELDQLRTAAAWALPHLAEAQRQHEFRATSANQALLLQNQAMERSTPMLPSASPRTSTEALHLPENCSAQAQEQAARQITEALLAQMRATAAECSLAGLSRQPAANERFEFESKAPPLSEASLDCSYRSAPFGATMSHSVAAPQPGHHANGAIPRLPQETPKRGLALEEMHKELERMEAVLLQVREENTKLREEKKAVEDAHRRDVSSLEAMLNQIMEENKRLTEAAASRANNQQVNKLDFSDRIMSMKQQVPMTPSSVRSEVEPAFEPSIDSSEGFDRRFNLGINSHTHQYMH